MNAFADFTYRAMQWIEQAGWLGVIAFIVLYSLTCVLFLPGSFLTIGAGAVYGFWFSAPLVAVSSTVGAVINFLTSRYFAHDWVQRKFGHNPKFAAMEEAMIREGWRLVFLSRLSPIVPHSLVSYAAGLIPMSCRSFTVASLVGFLPISMAYAYAGAVVGKVVRTHAGISQDDPVTWALYLLGLVATIAVLVLTTKAARDAWKTSLAEPPPPRTTDKAK